MSGASQWILLVTAAVILSAILTRLAGRGPMGTLVRYLAGIFVALSVISPLRDVDIPDFETWFGDYRYEGEQAAKAGEQLAYEKTCELIKTRVEAYILDKAASCGISAAVDVQLDGAGFPVSATVYGPCSPEDREKLSQIMEAELGIGREVQYWNE